MTPLIVTGRGASTLDSGCRVLFHVKLAVPALQRNIAWVNRIGRGTASRQSANPGVQQHPHGTADERAIDADVLQIRADFQLDLAADLPGVPTLYHAADQAGDLMPK